MEGWPFAAALASAFLHAAWNAAVKANAAPREAMSAQMMAAALLALPPLAWAGLPVAAAWPWLLASTLLGMVHVHALLRAYDSGGFGTVYPMARATSVLFVAAVAPAAMGETLGAGAAAGMACIALALLVLAADTRRAVPVLPRDAAPASSSRPSVFPMAALGWTLLAGGSAAAYVLADARGVRAAGSALSYGCAVSVSNALAMGWLTRSAGSPLTVLRRRWTVGLPAAFASMSSYLLILWVWQHAPVAPASALRDTSAIFAMLIAVLWLKEPLPARRAAALLLALAGLPLLRLG